MNKTILLIIVAVMGSVASAKGADFVSLNCSDSNNGDTIVTVELKNGQYTGEIDSSGPGDAPLKDIFRNLKPTISSSCPASAHCFFQYNFISGFKDAQGDFDLQIHSPSNPSAILNYKGVETGSGRLSLTCTTKGPLIVQ